MNSKWVKTKFELLFPIFNTESNNLFSSSKAYDVIKSKTYESHILLNLIDLDKVYVADFYAQQFPILKIGAIAKLTKDTKFLLQFIEKGNDIQYVYLFGKTLFLRKGLRERKYLVDAMLLDKTEFERCEILETLLAQSNIIHLIEKLTHLWSVEDMVFDSLVEKYHFLKDIAKNAGEALNSYDKGATALDCAMDDYGLVSSSS